MFPWPYLTNIKRFCDGIDSKKYPGFQSASITLLEQIEQNALWYEPQLFIDLLSEKDDNKFIELAVEAGAIYIVTGNSNDFILKSYNDISICSPKEFYDNQLKL